MLVFQPHRYTRTRDLLDDFANVLAGVDVLLVTEVYAAGEAPIKGADGRAMCRAVRSRGKVEPIFVSDIDEFAGALRGVLRAGDVIVTMGAGHIGAMAHELPRPGAGAGEPHAARERLTRSSRRFQGRVRYDEPMAAHTSWHAGGPADVLVHAARCRGPGRVPARCCRAEVPVYWVGLGSNLLVRDGGIRGVVIATPGAFTRIERRSQTRIYCEASVPCARIARCCVNWGLAQGEFFSGIPGTLGGALAMNAGAFGDETWRHVRRSRPSTARGERRVRAAAEYRVGYREVERWPSSEPAAPSEWFTVRPSCEFEPRAAATQRSATSARVR